MAPSDSPYVITVGSLSTSGLPAYATIIAQPDCHSPFTAVGPTTDGRIKPDLTVRGVDIAVALADGSYTLVSGTSVSAPLVSAMAVLALQQRPQYGPAEIREALLSTATHTTSISNKLGWGTPELLIALEYPIATVPPACLKSCSGFGECRSGICVCDSRHYHHDCSLSKGTIFTITHLTCAVDCASRCNGHCTDENVCYCAHGKTGVYCEIPFNGTAAFVLLWY